MMHSPWLQSRDNMDEMKGGKGKVDQRKQASDEKTEQEMLI